MSKSHTTKMNRLVAAVLSIATIGAVIATTTSSASAAPHHHRHHHGRAWGYGAGGLALGLLGAAAISQSGYGYGYGRSCYLQRQYDEDGNYMGRTRVCRRAYVD